VFHQVFDGGLGVVDEGEGCVDDFAKIVGRNVGGHADRDALAAVDQQVGESCGQNLRLFFAAVEVVGEVDGVLVDAINEPHRQLRKPTLGVTHRRGLVVW